MIKIEDKLYDRVENITFTDYERKDGEVTEDNAYEMIYDLVISYEALRDAFKEYKEMVRDNYEEISPYRKYAVSESDFY